MTMEEALKEFRESPDYLFSMTHSTPLEEAIADAPDVVKEAIRSSKVRGCFVVETVTAVREGEELVSEDGFRDLVARVTNAHVDVFARSTLRRLFLILSVIARNIPSDVYNELVADPSKLTSSAGVTPRKATRSEEEAETLDTSRRQVHVAPTPKQPPPPTDKVEQGEKGEKGRAVSVPSGGDDDDDDSRDDELEAREVCERRLRVEQVIMDPARWSLLDAQQRYELIQELRRWVPEKAGDAKDAASYLHATIRMLLGGADSVEVRNHLLDAMLFFRYRATLGYSAALAFRTETEVPTYVSNKRKHAIAMAHKKGAERSNSSTGKRSFSRDMRRGEPLFPPAKAARTTTSRGFQGGKPNGARKRG
eukprot:TRINITY_DN10605_c0_g1_i1.p1 TRINITY_DN10605_c0_g1~~TRINITY_DN10605_c0_g1_i1.p1  ORF type:complete len:365 (+),score=98.62 TRINITY_DN10605_c0_g1_i1:78-1172(+)